MPIDTSKPYTPMDEFLKVIQQGTENRAAWKKQQQENENAKADRELKKQLMEQRMPLLAAQIDVLKSQAEKNRNGGFSADKLTKANITKNQQVIQAVDNTIPVLQDLIKNISNVPGQKLFKYLHPNLQATYKGKTAEIKDTLMTALNLQKTDKGMETVEDMIERKPQESDENYKSRLQSVVKRLLSRKENAKKASQKGISLDELSLDELPKDDTVDTNEEQPGDTTITVDDVGGE